MTDLNINAGDIAAAIRKNLEGFSPNAVNEHLTRFLSVKE